MNTLPSLAEIRWRCRRGMLELELLLNPFLENEYLTLPKLQQEQFLEVLALPDPDLYNWLMGSNQALLPSAEPLIERIRAYHQQVSA